MYLYLIELDIPFTWIELLAKTIFNQSLLPRRARIRSRSTNEPPCTRRSALVGLQLWSIRNCTRNTEQIIKAYPLVAFPVRHDASIPTLEDNQFVGGMETNQR